MKRKRKNLMVESGATHAPHSAACYNCKRRFEIAETGVDNGDCGDVAGRQILANTYTPELQLRALMVGQSGFEPASEHQTARTGLDRLNIRGVHVCNTCVRGECLEVFSVSY
jgi:hypothetical protein